MSATASSELEIYGGEQEKLLSTMRSDRDKATGERTFPNLTEDMVQRWHEMWHEIHPETAKWQNRVKYQCRSQGYVEEAWSGRKRYFPGGPSKKNAPVNHPIQGFAGAIQNEALEEIDREIPHRGWSRYSGLFTNVHDYLGVFAPESHSDRAKHIIEKAMLKTYKGMKFTATAEVSRKMSEQ